MRGLIVSAAFVIPSMILGAYQCFAYRHWLLLRNDSFLNTRVSYIGHGCLSDSDGYSHDLALLSHSQRQELLHEQKTISLHRKYLYTLTQGILVPITTIAIPLIILLKTAAGCQSQAESEKPIVVAVGHICIRNCLNNEAGSPKETFSCYNQTQCSTGQVCCTAFELLSIFSPPSQQQQNGTCQPFFCPFGQIPL
ncbi:unnamed protein product, partial [Mesorhabditis belari]|uniref:Uncharacterized protein n=1 Tax=Mesorhabditis belari TaxID=2138241 RepID=A0AAF3JA23_9BILA